MRRTIKVSEDTYNLLNDEKGNETSLDGAIRRLILAKELLPENAQLGLQSLSTHAERGVFLAGMLYTSACQHNWDLQKATRMQVENLNPGNFMKLYTRTVMELGEVFEKKADLERLSEMASFELLKGDIEAMANEDMRYCFTLGQTLSAK